MRVVAALLLTSVWLQAQSLQSLIDQALASNPSIEAISQRVSAQHSTVELSESFANPQLILGLNDIQSRDPFKRDLEPMQSASLTLKQKLPFFGKRDARKARAQATESAMAATLQDARNSLVRAIRTEAYSLWEQQALYKLICRYEELAERNIELHETYTATSGKSSHHMGIMAAELTLSELKIQKSAYLRNIQTGLERLGYLAAAPVQSLELELKMEKMEGSRSYEAAAVNNPTLLAKRKEVAAAEASVREASLLAYPDPTLSLGYFQREAYEDYLSLAIGTELPLYGSERKREERERALLLAKKAQSADLNNAVASQIAIAYEKMKQAYTVYHIITEQSIPKIEHMFDLASASVQSGGDLFGYMELLEKRLRLDTRRIQTLSSFHKAKAAIAALTGEAL